MATPGSADRPSPEKWGKGGNAAKEWPILVRTGHGGQIAAHVRMRQRVRLGLQPGGKLHVAVDLGDVGGDDFRRGVRSDRVSVVPMATQAVRILLGGLAVSLVGV